MARDQDAYEMYIEEALVALGGDEAPDYIIKAQQGAEIACPECGPLYTVGEIELWEAVADVRQHTVEVHTTQAAIRQSKQDRLDAERMADEHG